MATPLRVVVGYFVLLLVVRLLPRRPGAQMTPFEFVIVFLIGGVIIGATVDHDKSVTNCGSAIVTVALLHNFLAWVKTKSTRLARLVDGTPLLLLERGQWRPETMKGMRIDPADAMAAARTKGIGSLDRIRYAVLERHGAISVLEEEEGS